jgi:hypothetical protein
MTSTPGYSTTPADQERQSILLPALGIIEPRQTHVGKLHPAEQLPRRYWESCGFTLLEASPEQAQIGGVPALLPSGWTFHPTADTCIATLIDDRGRGRAFLAIPSPDVPQSCVVPWPRFTITPHFAPTVDTPEPGEGEERFTHWCYKVIDHFFLDPHPDGLQGRLVFSSPAFETGHADEERSGHVQAKQSCKLWLHAHWPEWENPFAYWGEEEKR